MGALGGEIAGLEIGAVVERAGGDLDLLGHSGADAAVAAAPSGDGDGGGSHRHPRLRGDVRECYTFDFFSSQWGAFTDGIRNGQPLDASGNENYITPDGAAIDEA